MDNYRYRLFQAVAHAFGHYMGIRLSGFNADIRLQRYRKLGKALSDYDKTTASAKSNE